MRVNLLFAAFAVSLYLLVFPAKAAAQQSPQVWVDANGNVHSSPPESAPSSSSTTTTTSATDTSQTLPSYAQPGNSAVSSTPPSVGARPATTAVTATHYVHYVPWLDPAEKAFSVSLPQGWQISGGTVRAARTETHLIVRAQSPDGGVHLFLDVSHLIPGKAPHGTAFEANLYLNPVMHATAGESLSLDEQHPENEFAALYAHQILCPSAENMRGGPLVEQTDDLARLFDPISKAEGVPIQAHAGEVSFRCGPSIGYVYALTVQARQPGGSNPQWAADRLAGYLATPANAALAAWTVNRLLATFQIDQAWLQRYAQANGDAAGNVLRESDAIAQSMKDRSQDMHSVLQASLASARSEVASASGVPVPAANSGSSRSYTARLRTRKVCDEAGRCQTVNAAIDNWYSDCSGRFYPGSVTGGPPPANMSACWSKGN